MTYSPPRRAAMFDVLEAMAAKAGYDATDILGKSRKGPLVEVRQAIMHKLHRELSIPSVAVAVLMRRDHSTVVHGCNAHEARLAKASAIASAAQEIEAGQ